MLPVARSRGASLLEVIVALIVLGILAGVGVGRWIDRQGQQLAAARAELRATLQQAQRLALVKNREVCVLVAANQMRLRLNPTTTAGAPCSVDVPGPDGQALVVEVAEGLSAVPAAFRYRVDGQPQPAPIVLTLGAPGSATQLRVLPVTGYID